jgi:hypothetical protein
MTRLFERLRLQAHFKGLRDRWGQEADSIVLDALERSWANDLETPALDLEHDDSQ